MTKMADFIISTTSSLEGYIVREYLGPVSTNIVTGTGLFSDVAASFSDIFGGRSESYQKQFKSIYDEIEKSIVTLSKRKGANAILGFRVDYDELSGKTKQMLMVSAMGTAVFIEKVKEADSFHSLSQDSNKINLVTSDELNEKIQIEAILNESEFSRVLNEKQWELLIKHADTRAVEPILKIILKYEEDLRFQEYAKLYFLNLSPDIIKMNIYPALAKNQKLFKFGLNIIKEAKLFDVDYFLWLLEDKDPTVRKRALLLLTTDKHFYSADDIGLFQKIIEKIQSTFPVLSNIENRKGLMGSKEKWTCAYCKRTNLVEKEYCECGQDRWGFTVNEINPEQAINGLRWHIKILKEFFNKSK